MLLTYQIKVLDKSHHTEEHKHSIAPWHCRIVYIAWSAILLPKMLPNLLSSVMMAL
jgi:hypothetical protein